MPFRKFRILIPLLLVFITVQIFAPSINNSIENQNSRFLNEDGGNTVNIDSPQLSSTGEIFPNLSRIDYPIVLNRENSEEIWTYLHGHHRDNIRVLYFGENNEWNTVSYQIDEKAYFRTYKYSVGSQCTLNAFGIPTDIDMTNWGHYEAEHRFVGKDIDAQPGDPYKEPTKYECEAAFWPTREAEHHVGTSIPPEPPEQDPREQPGGEYDQLEYRIDWDDEICFYGKNGRKVSNYVWWNYEQYPNRICMEITDPVDGTRGWMYIYYNDVNLENPPHSTNYFAEDDTDHVSWNKEELKITADDYELEINENNNELYKNLRIKLPNAEPNDLYTETNKNYFSNYYTMTSTTGITLTFEDDIEQWREGTWDAGYYDEVFSGIGYGITIDLDLDPNLSGVDLSAFPGQDTNYENSHRRTSLYGDYRHYSDDTYKESWGQVSGELDGSDHDWDIEENGGNAFVRGVVDFSQASNEAALDGPCRVVIDKTTIEILSFYWDGNTAPFLYEEFWTVVQKQLIFYGNSHVVKNGIGLDFDVNDPSNTEQDFSYRCHFGFMNTQRLSDFVRNDPGSYIILGNAPNAISGIDINYPQAYSGYKTWPVYLYPDGNPNNDGVMSGGNPQEGHYDDSYLLPSTGAQNNPLSDWQYIHTSSGGVLSYIPYQDLKENLFTDNEDLATYWKDTGDSGYTEIGIYGNDAQADYDLYADLLYAFGNYSLWECYREYARLNEPLGDSVSIQHEVWGGGPNFENVELYKNNEKLSTVGYVKNGDNIELIVDLNNDYTPSLIDVDVSSLTSDVPMISQIDSTYYIYNISFTVNTANPDSIPPSMGYEADITINTDPIASFQQPFYLDNTDPSSPTLSVSQSGRSSLLEWTYGSDNSGINYYEIYRNEVLIGICDNEINLWSDGGIQDGNSYEYYIKAYDKSGNSAISNKESITIDLDYLPAQLNDIEQYFNDYIELDWNNEKGDTNRIERYEVRWAESPDGPWTGNGDDHGALGWESVGVTDFKDTFTPLSDDPSPRNGEYYFRVVSSDGEQELFSSIKSCYYDDESPLPGTIVNIEDSYHPSSAQIHVQWGGAFDAFSGIDYYVLERKIGSAGTFQQIGNDFSVENYEFYDTDLCSLGSDEEYYYRLKVYDKAGNSILTNEEYVHYYTDNIASEPSFIINSITPNKTASGIGENEVFEVDIKIDNLGGGNGWVDSILLSFYSSEFLNVSNEFNFTNLYSLNQLISGGNNQEFTIEVFAKDVPDLHVGEINLKATLVWNDGSNTFNEIDEFYSESIYIREFIELESELSAPTEVYLNTQNNIVNLTISNQMITDVIITSAWINFSGEWDESTDFILRNGPNNPSFIEEYVLEGKEILELTYEIDIAINAEPIGDINISYGFEAYESLTSIVLDAFYEKNKTWEAIYSPGPIISNAQLNPATVLLGKNISLSIEARELAWNQSVSGVQAYIYDPSSSLLDIINLEFQGGNLYNSTWNTTTQDLGKGYYVIFIATDNDTVNGPYSTESAKLSFEITLGLGIGYSNVTVYQGYIGYDDIEIIIPLRNWIDISYSNSLFINNISIIFGEDEEFNHFFHNQRINGSEVSSFFDYTLLTSDEFTFFNITYSIEDLDEFDMIYNNSIKPLKIFIEYSNMYGEFNATSEILSVENRINYINLLKIPEIYSANMTFSTESNGFITSDEILFSVNATHYQSYYNVYLNLTNWGLDIMKMELPQGSSTFFTYNLQKSLLSDGLYLGAEISAIVNISEQFLNYREDKMLFTEQFSVDGLNPIANLTTIYLSSTEMDPSEDLLFEIQITDNKSAGVYSDVQYAVLYFQSETISDNLHLHHINGDIWGVYINSSVLKEQLFKYGLEISLTKIFVEDNTGNSETFTIQDITIKIIDKITPEIDFLESSIGDKVIGDKDNFLLRNVNFFTVNIKIDDGSFGSSGIYYVKIYYKILGENEEVSDSTEWEYLKLGYLSKGSYSAIFSKPNQSDIFTPQKFVFYLEISDFAGNKISTSDTLIQIHFEDDINIVSYVFIGFAIVSFFGAVVYRLTFYRTKARIPDVSGEKGKFSKLKFWKKKNKGGYEK